MSTATCPSCGAEVFDQARFCEVCGASTSGDGSPTSGAPTVGAPTVGEAGDDRSPLAEPPSEGRHRVPCASCVGVIAADGYCQTCGARAVSERDHFEEEPAAWLAGTCDRGIRHERNEDAMALAVLPSPGAVPAPADSGQVGVIVVCDGVSSSTDPDRASLEAARAARVVLTGSWVQGMGTADAHASAVTARVRQACSAAQEAVVGTTSDRSLPNPASCTIVAAALDGDLLAVGWVGDSRAYWLPDDPATARALTVDDSVAAERMALGVPRAQAESGPQSHAITRWLGVDSPDEAAHTITATLDQPGWVLVCSDGLWNYCSEAADLAVLVADLAGGSDGPLPLSRALVDWAKDRGGHDNITVGLARVSGTAEPREPAGTTRGSTPDG
jgi:serine/threonine protein phosphatase PrpC